jgi:hypothetical protein
MKAIRELPHRVLSTLRARLRPETRRNASDDVQPGKGQNLLRLHEYQHRVIVDIFKTSMAGFFAFALILLSFSLNMLLEANSPSWIAYLMVALALLLLGGLHRTVREFKAYRKNYEEITEQLRNKVVQQMARGGASLPVAKSKGGIEQRLLSALRPKEYKGWDAKPCRSCGRPIELLATACPACGHDQDAPLVN